jgi:hypothetical protein
MCRNGSVIGLGRRNRTGIATLARSPGDHRLGRRRRGLADGLMAPGATAATTTAVTAAARTAAA